MSICLPISTIIGYVWFMVLCAFIIGFLLGTILLYYLIIYKNKI